MKCWHLTKWTLLVVLCLRMSIGLRAADQPKVQHPTLATAAPKDANHPSREAIEFFEKEIRPLLIKRCHECHSGTKPKGGLKMTSRQDILTGGSTGPAAIPGKPRDSLLIEAIEHAGGFDMPPKGKMPDSEIVKLTKWVEMGLPWPGEQAAPIAAPTSSADEGYVITDAQKKHWAFQPVRDAVVPCVVDSAWPAGDIDRFVLSQLERKGLHPNSPADRRTLLRRVTFDLTGLPPTPDEIRDFLADNSPNAFARVVDRLLTSPHYGERWGRHWLDVARYADTAGDGADYPVREAYKYRNWVIDAFNQDKPYHEFLKEQIAGDILAQSAPREKYAAMVTATGFLAATRRYGYAPNDDFRHLDISDTIDVVGKSALGLSLGCARCHNHKYDPISVGDYYGLYGIFDSSQFSFPGGEEHKRPEFLVPLVPPAELKDLDAKWKKQLADAKAELATRKDEWIALLKKEAPTIGGVDLAFESQKLNAPLNDLFPQNGPTKVLAEAQSPFTNVYSAGTRGLRFPRTESSSDLVRYSWSPASKLDQPLHLNFDFRAAPENLREKLVGPFHLYVGHEARKSALLDLAASLDDFAVTDGDNYVVIRKLQPNVWYNVQLKLDLKKRTFSGSISAPGDVVSFSDKRFHPQWDGVVDTLRIDGAGHRPGPRLITDFDNLAIAGTAFPPISPATVHQGDRSLTESDRAERAKYEVIRKKSEQAEAAVVAARAKHSHLEAHPPYELAYAVSEDPTKAGHSVRVQLRGEPTKLGADAPRRFLSILGGDKLPEKFAGSGRLQLADWLTRPENPLTARVMVNRLWHYHFGRGLAPIPSDFGIRGEPPSHPELLDYLAKKFMANGWSIKAMHREMLLSKTYQQSSLDQDDALRIDPENVWLWKFSRRRLDAESIRDGMLFIAGTLDFSRNHGFPFPELHKWNFTIHNQFRMPYDSHQRSIYLLSMRLTRQPFLSLFDGADPSNTTDNRPETTTPTQALYLMNSPFVHEQSQALATKLLAEEKDDAARVRRVSELVIGNPVESDDVSTALAFVDGYRRKLSAAGVPEKVQMVQAWSAYARVLLTSNGFLYID